MANTAYPTAAASTLLPWQQWDLDHAQSAAQHQLAFRAQNAARQSMPHPATAAPAPSAPAAPAPTPAPAATNPQNTAINAFYQTPLYQFPLQQGLEAINASYAANDTLESGAAQKSLESYAAGQASGGLRDYLSLLGNQQALGYNAAAAQTGVASNYSNSITGANGNYQNSLSNANSQFANNSSNLFGNYANGVSGAVGNYGNAVSQGATNTGNILSQGAYANAQNNNGLLNGLGNILGQTAGYFAYRPYGS